MVEDTEKLQLADFTEEEKDEIKSFCDANNMTVKQFLMKSVLYCLYKRVFLKEMKLIGQFLMEDRIITQEQLEGALHMQEETKELLGSILVRMGFLDEDTLTKYLAIQVLES